MIQYRNQIFDTHCPVPLQLSLNDHLKQKPVKAPRGFEINYQQFVPTATSLLSGESYTLPMNIPKKNESRADYHPLDDVDVCDYIRTKRGQARVRRQEESSASERTRRAATQRFANT